MPLFGKKKSAVDDGADKAIVAGGIDNIDAEVFSMRGREAASVVRFVSFLRARDRETAPFSLLFTEEARESKKTNREKVPN